MARPHKKYGIKTIKAGGIEGLDALYAKLNALPETVAEGTRRGMERAAGEIRAAAVDNIASVDGEIAQAITAESAVEGDKVTARVFVTPAGFDPVQWPVFTEMGTGPHGIESSGGPSGLKYPLPASAYTQQPWVYMDDKGEYRISSGMYANPYLWPAYQAKKPYIREIVSKAIMEEVKGEGE